MSGIRKNERMKLFRSIFIAVVLISPTLAWGAVSATWIEPHDTNTFSRYAQEYSDSVAQALCKNGNGYVQTINGVTIYVTCADGWIKDTVPTDDEFTKAHHIAECHVQCASNGMVYASGSSDTHCYCNSSSESQKDKKNARSNRSASAASGASASKTEATGKSKKSDDEEEPSVAFNEPSYSFGVDYTPEVIEVDDRRAAVRAYEDYLVKTFCKKDNGHVTISDGGSYQDKITVNCTGWKKDISKPRTAENEHAVALCHARCAGLGQAYESGNFIGTYTSSCKCQTTRAEKRAANQQARDERKAARAEDRAARQEKRADERAARQEERKKEKAVECDGRNPPMDIKQNDLGLWVCVDTDETIKKREEERKTNKTLDAFWNEMEDLERAFNKRVRQLQRQAKKDGGAK